MKGKTICVSMLGDQIALMTLDMPQKGANVLTAEVLDELEETLGQIQHWSDLQKVVIASAKPTIFVAGADLNYIAANLGFSKSQVEHFCQRGHRLFGTIANLQCPTVAAVGGVCVGGGLELALACDARVAVDEPAVQLGLPEVKLGLIPGWGGTVRLPRLIGVEKAIDLITSGRLITPKEAAEIGLVDELASRDHLIDSCVKFIKRGSDRREGDRASTAHANIIEDHSDSIVIAAEQAIAGRSNSIHPWAPTVALRQIWSTRRDSLAKALEAEAAAMAEVWGSDANAGLLNAFFLDDWLKKSPGNIARAVQPQKIEHVAIIGTGQMGQQIARAALRHMHQVSLYDADHRKAAAAAEQLTTEIGAAGAKRQVHLLTSLEGLRRCHLVLECVVENESVKQQVLAQIEPHLSESAVLASNTSMISLNRLVQAIDRPKQFCGLHFCHPIDRRKIVEVVRGQSTSDLTLTSAIAWVKSIGMRPVAVHDSPGFVVNRLLAPMLDEAVALAFKGVAPETIDQGATAFGFQDPPLQFIDAIGVDTAFHTGLAMLNSVPHCVTLNPVLPRMFKQGRLGRKSGRGFYSYGADGSTTADPTWREATGVEQHLEMDVDTVGKRLALVMLSEAIRLLDEQVVRDHRDIDYCSIHGSGFPSWRGGILFWADRSNLSSLADELRNLGQQRPGVGPTARLERMISQGQQFYSKHSG